MQKKTIYINGRFLTQKLTGVQRFALETVLALDEIAGDYPHYQFVLLSPKIASSPMLNNIKHRVVGRLSGMLWENIELPWFARNGFLVNLGNTAPILKQKQMVVIHDLAVYSYPQNFNYKFRLWYRSLYWLLKTTGVKFATVSRFSQGEIYQYLNIPQEQVAVLTEGKEHLDQIKPDHAILSQHKLEGSQFVLAVGSVKPNKNFSVIAKLLEKHHFPNTKFVIAGGLNQDLFKDIGTLPESIVQVGYVTDEELKALYEAAACFVFPSLYEGFGIPPLEAMTSGCPVISANTSSIPEVCGDAVLYFEPDHVAALNSQLNKVLTDEAFRKRMVQNGHAQAGQFSWRQNAQLLISSCIDGNG